MKEVRKQCSDCIWADEDEQYDDHDWWWEIVGCRKGNEIHPKDPDEPCKDFDSGGDQS